MLSVKPSMVSKFLLAQRGFCALTGGPAGAGRALPLEPVQRQAAEEHVARSMSTTDGGCEQLSLALSQWCTTDRWLLRRSTPCSFSGRRRRDAAAKVRLGAVPPRKEAYGSGRCWRNQCARARTPTRKKTYGGRTHGRRGCARCATKPGWVTVPSDRPRRAPRQAQPPSPPTTSPSPPLNKQNTTTPDHSSSPTELN